MQPIPLSEINRRHPSPPPPVIALVVRLDLLDPEVARLLVAVLAEADVDQEVAVVLGRLEVICFLVGRPLVDRARAGGDAVPAAVGAGALGFVVHGGAEGDDALDLGGWLALLTAVPCLLLEDPPPLVCWTVSKVKDSPYQAPATPSAP